MQMLICSFVWFRFPFMLWPTDMVSTLKISISFNLNLSVAWINWTSGTESLNEGRSCSRSSFLFIWNYSSGSEVVFFTSGSGKPVKTQWVKYRSFTSWILVWRQQHASAERFFSFLFLFPHVFRSYPSHLSLISWLFFHHDQGKVFRRSVTGIFVWSVCCRRLFARHFLDPLANWCRIIKVRCCLMWLNVLWQIII